jgi:hypothetical protein
MNGPIDPKKVVRFEYAGVVRFIYADKIECKDRAETSRHFDDKAATSEICVDKRIAEITVSGELLETSKFDEAEWRLQLASTIRRQWEFDFIAKVQAAATALEKQTEFPTTKIFINWQTLFELRSFDMCHRLQDGDTRSFLGRTVLIDPALRIWEFRLA